MFCIRDTHIQNVRCSLVSLQLVWSMRLAWSHPFYFLPLLVSPQIPNCYASLSKEMYSKFVNIFLSLCVCVSSRFQYYPIWIQMKFLVIKNKKVAMFWFNSRKRLLFLFNITVRFNFVHIFGIGHYAKHAAAIVQMKTNSNHKLNDTDMHSLTHTRTQIETHRKGNERFYFFTFCFEENVSKVLKSSMYIHIHTYMIFCIFLGIKFCCLFTFHSLIFNLK